MSQRPHLPGGVVTLTSDFGVAGHHVGVLKGVILAQNPAAVLVDLSHEIAPCDVRYAAWTLRWSWRWFPEGTVHLVVVDPGVGSSRRPLAARAGGHFFVGPDNGVLDPALVDAGGAETIELGLHPPPPSTTFHGRDVFAPAAGLLSLGVPPASLGKTIADRVRLDLPRAQLAAPGRLTGEVITVDRWGNLVTSVTAGDLAHAGIDARARLRVGHRTLTGIRECYAQASPRKPIALINSSGHLEIAVNRGRADEHFHAAPGTPLVVSGTTHPTGPATTAARPGKER